MADTNVINRVAFHATAETAHPTVVAKGLNIAQSAWSAASFVTGGSVARHGDDFDITDSAVEKEIERKVEEIMQTRGFAAEDLILLQNRVKSFTVECEDVSEAVHALASDVSITSNVATNAAGLTFRTGAVEINGLCLEYYPNIAIFIDGDTAGYGEGGKGMITLICMVLAGATITQGSSKEWYQSA